MTGFVISVIERQSVFGDLCRAYPAISLLRRIREY